MALCCAARRYLYDCCDGRRRRYDVAFRDLWCEDCRRYAYPVGTRCPRHGYEWFEKPSWPSHLVQPSLFDK